MDIAATKVALAGMLGNLFAFTFNTGSQTYQLSATQHIRANAQAPMSLADSDLPTFILFTGPARYPSPPDQSMNRLAMETRDYIAALFVAYGQAGIDGEAERKVEPYVDYVRDQIQKHLLFYDGNQAHIVPGIMRAYLTGDDGIVTLRYGTGAPQNYVGLRYTIRVEGRNIVTYGNE